MIFLDTSAIVAMVDHRDEFHERAIKTAENLSGDGSQLWTHNYLIVEAAAVLQRKLGQRKLGIGNSLILLARAEDIAKIHWVTPQEHERAVYRLDQRNRRNLSFVDCVSFVLMEQYDSTTAFAYDSDFETEGFQLVG